MDEPLEPLDPLSDRALDRDVGGDIIESSDEETDDDSIGCSPFSLPMLVGIGLILGEEE